MPLTGIAPYARLYEPPSDHQQTVLVTKVQTSSMEPDRLFLTPTDEDGSVTETYEVVQNPDGEPVLDLSPDLEGVQEGAWAVTYGLGTKNFTPTSLSQVESSADLHEAVALLEGLLPPVQAQEYIKFGYVQHLFRTLATPLAEEALWSVDQLAKSPALVESSEGFVADSEVFSKIQDAADTKVAAEGLKDFLGEVTDSLDISSTEDLLDYWDGQAADRDQEPSWLKNVYTPTPTHLSRVYNTFFLIYYLQVVQQVPVGLCLATTSEKINFFPYWKNDDGEFVFYLNDSDHYLSTYIYSDPKDLIDEISKVTPDLAHVFLPEVPLEVLLGLYNRQLTSVEEIAKALLDTRDQTPVSEDVMRNLSEAPSASVRKQIMDLIKKVYDILDKTGLNTQAQLDHWNKLSETAFTREFKKFLEDPKANFTLEVLPNKNEPSLRDIRNALKAIKIPENEYVYFRHMGEKPVRTRYEVPVGYLHIKRLQQILSKKNAYSLDVSSRNMKTNQVTGADKIARISDLEVTALSAINADNVLKEFLSARSDDSQAKHALYQQIATYGYAKLEELPDKLENKQTLNTISYYLTAAGIENDMLVDDRALEELKNRF